MDLSADLHDAAADGDLDELKRLLMLARRAGKDPKIARNHAGQTSLHSAARHGHLDCLRELLASGFDKEAQDKYGSTPLHQAAREGCVECVRELLASGCSKEARSHRRWTALHFAVRFGQPACLRELLAAGCEQEARSDDGWTPLHFAANIGHIECLRELLASGCDKEARSNDGFTPLHYAATGDAFEALLSTQVHCTLLASTSLAADEHGRQQLETAFATVRECLNQHTDSTAMSLVLFDDYRADVQLDHVPPGALRLGGFVPPDDRRGCATSTTGWRACQQLLRKSGKGVHECVLLFTSTPLEPPANDDIRKLLHEYNRRLCMVQGITVGQEAEGASTGLPLQQLRDEGVDARVLTAGSEGALLEAVRTAVADIGVLRQVGGRGGIHKLRVNQISGARITEVDRRGLRFFADIKEKIMVAVTVHLKRFGHEPEEWSSKLMLNDAITPADNFEVADIPLSEALTLVVFDEIKAHVCTLDMPEGQKRMLERHLRLIRVRFKELPDHLRKELDEDAQALLRLLFQLPAKILVAFVAKPDLAVQVLKTVPAIKFIRDRIEEHLEDVEVEQGAGREGATDYDLADPNGLVDFLVDADIRPVRLEYLLELLESGRALPRRQEAQKERTKMGLPAFVTVGELQQVDINPETFHASIMVAHPMPRRITVRFVSISHVWESMQHPDPWRFQLQSVVDEYRCRLVDSVVWIFFDFLSLYQYERDADEERVFRLALQGMHLLYSHEAVEVQRIEALTPKEFQDGCLARNGPSIPVYWEDGKKVTDVRIDQLKLNHTPYGLRGWCQAERQWAALRTSMKDEFPVPLPPHVFRERMQQLLFTHREDSDRVFQLQAKLFRQKAATTTKLLVEGLDAEKIADLAAALPFYKRLTEIVLTAVPEHTAWKVAVAVVDSGACDVQIAGDSFRDVDAVNLSAALLTEGRQLLDRLHLMCNRLGDPGRDALKQMMEHHRLTSGASSDLIIEGSKQVYVGGESEEGQPEHQSATLRILVHRRRGDLVNWVI